MIGRSAYPKMDTLHRINRIKLDDSALFGKYAVRKTLTKSSKRLRYYVMIDGATVYRTTSPIQAARFIDLRWSNANQHERIF
jgi:hypothetical protein